MQLVGHRREANGLLLTAHCGADVLGRARPNYAHFRLQLICTDFDGTLHSDFTELPVPYACKPSWPSYKPGATWGINTGRTLDDLRLGIDHAKLTVHPDYVVVVEREIFRCVDCQLRTIDRLERRCTRTQSALFASIADRYRIVRLGKPALQCQCVKMNGPLLPDRPQQPDADAIQEYVDAFAGDRS